MIYPTQINNHVEETQNLLLSQFKNSPNILKLLEIYANQIQELEIEWFNLLDSLGIDTATGYALDVIGKEVRELRLGRNDTDYRNAILTKVFINNASGTPEDVIAATKQITNASDVYYSEQYPASVVLEVIGAEYVSKAPTIKKTLPAAVDLVFKKNIDVDMSQSYVGVAYSYIKDFESNPL